MASNTPPITETTTVQTPTETTTVPPTQTPQEGTVSTEENKGAEGISQGQDINPPQEGDQTPPGEGTQPTGNQVPPEDVETLKAKLQEYELDQQELNQLKQRLGVDNVDYGTAQIAQTLDMVENRAQQEYVKLCTKYGVDSRPEMLEASAKALQERDPKAFYEFQLNLDRLATARNNQLAEIQNYSTSREVNKFYTDNQPILDASPSITSVLRDYINSTPQQYVTREGMNYYLDKAREIYTEAYYAGLQAAQKGQALDPNKLLNNSVAGSQQTTYPMGSSVFTKEQVAKMSLEEFAKNEKEIMKQMMNGQIK